MPGGDRTGPRGLGPRSGRQAGYCAGASAPGYGTQRGGGGHTWGRGNGGHRGWRHRYFANSMLEWGRRSETLDTSPNPDSEGDKQLLRDQARNLQSELDRINKRLDELEPKGESD